ncbi:hypothetical protein HBB16_12615 [Pseudonocardia sp. MCCB 268]|nr:hypothetical protein [Pseudonocardia cytotoxica]
MVAHRGVVVREVPQVRGGDLDAERIRGRMRSRSSWSPGHVHPTTTTSPGTSRRDVPFALGIEVPGS